MIGGTMCYGDKAKGVWVDTEDCLAMPDLSGLKRNVVY